jgi:hypothetical protein
MPNPSLAKKRDAGSVAVVVRYAGIGINYGQEKAKGATSMFGGIGGMLIQQKAADSKAGEDAAREAELKKILDGWNLGAQFADDMVKNFKSQYKNVMKTIVAPEGFDFAKVDRSFYKKGSKFEKGEDIYDYTPLANDGIDTVIDVVVAGALTSTSTLTKTVTPTLSASARVIDLQGKEVVDAKTITSPYSDPLLGPKINPSVDMDAKIDKFAENGGEHTKYCFSKLAEEAARITAKKLE